MNNPVTRGRTLAAAIAIAVLGGLLVAFPADAIDPVDVLATSPVWLDTVAKTGTDDPDPNGSFPTPLVMVTGVPTPSQVFPGDQFELNVQVQMVLSEEFLAGAAATACAVFTPPVKVEQAEVNNITVPIPLPPNVAATSGATEEVIEWDAGLVTIGSWANTTSDCTDEFTPTPGGVTLVSPDTSLPKDTPTVPPTDEFYVATGSIGNTIDFRIDETPRVDPITQDNATQTVSNADIWWFVRIPVGPVFINVGFGAQVGTKRPVAPAWAGPGLVVLLDPLPPHPVLEGAAASYSVFLNETGTDTATVTADGVGDLVVTCTSATCGSAPNEFSTGEVIDPPPSVVFFGPYTQPAFHSIEIVQPPVPFVQVDDVVGQKVESHARSDDTLAFSGSNWTPSTTVTGVDLCDNIDGTGACDGLTNFVASVDGSGDLSGTGEVPAGATTGSRFLFVETADEFSSPDFGATPTITVLGAPTLSATPDPIPLGGTANLSGANWNPLSLVEVSLSDPADPLTNQVTGVGAVDGAGMLTGSVVIDDALLTALGIATVPPQVDINVTDVDPDTGTATAIYTETVSLNEVVLNPLSRTTNDPDTGVPPTDAQLQQVIEQEITPGVLTFSQQNAVITMSPIQLDGTTQQSSGAINEVTVVDARGTLEGWTINVTMTDLILAGEDPLAPTTNRFIPAGNVLFTPACSTDHGDPLEITTGAGGALDNAVPQLLCDGAVGGGGGTFRGNADLDATIPPTVASGDYSAIMTLLIF